MKIQSWVKHPALLILTVLLFSCSTTALSKEDQITATAIRLADTLVQNQDYQQACSVYTKAIEKSDDYRLFYNLAIIQSYLDEDWTSTIKTAIKKNPDKKSQFLNLSVSLSEDDSMTETLLESLELLLIEKPEDPSLRKKLCKALVLDGQKERALEKALELWDEGEFDSETASILYSINPTEWEAVYKTLVKEE